MTLGEALPVRHSIAGWRMLLVTITVLALVVPAPAAAADPLPVGSPGPQATTPATSERPMHALKGFSRLVPRASLPRPKRGLLEIAAPSAPVLIGRNRLPMPIRAARRWLERPAQWVSAPLVRGVRMQAVREVGSADGRRRRRRLRRGLPPAAEALPRRCLWLPRCRIRPRLGRLQHRSDEWRLVVHVLDPIVVILLGQPQLQPAVLGGLA